MDTCECTLAVGAQDEPEATLRGQAKRTKQQLTKKNKQHFMEDILFVSVYRLSEEPVWLSETINHLDKPRVTQSQSPGCGYL